MHTFEDKSRSQEPFSPDLLSDSVRQVYGVPSLAEGLKQMKENQARESGAEKK